MKNRKKLSLKKRFERAVSQCPGEDPIFPLLMYSIERYLKGEKKLSDVDKKIHPILKKHSLPNAMLQTWIDGWYQIPASIKNKFVPQELRDLKPAYELNHMVMAQMMERMKMEWPRVGSGLRDKNFKKVLGRARSVRIAQILPQDMENTPFLYAGQPFSITGKGFQKSPKQQVISFFSNAEPPELILSIYPVASTPTLLQAVAPLSDELPEGGYKIQVTVKDVGSSEMEYVYAGQAPSAAAVLTSISPAAQLPGKTVVIHGNGFKQTPRVHWESVESSMEGGIGDFCDAKYQNDGSVMLEIPQRLVAAPGKYRIAVAGDQQQLSNWMPLTILPFKYQIEFTALECLDESNPEWLGDDEIVTQWAIACDQQSWAKQSAQYNGMYDRVVKTFSAHDRQVFVPNQSAGPVQQSLCLGISVYEWDAGDAEAWSKAFDIAADVCTAFELLGAFIGALLKVIAKLISLFGGDPDHLGTKTYLWTPEMLFAMTSNVERQYINRMAFKNDNDTGSYQLHYCINRFDA